jgi:hypothetical protein
MSLMFASFSALRIRPWSVYVVPKAAFAGI